MTASVGIENRINTPGMTAPIATHFDCSGLITRGAVVADPLDRGVDANLIKFALMLSIFSLVMLITAISL